MAQRPPGTGRGGPEGDRSADPDEYGTEAEIAAHWKEEAKLAPPPRLAETANVRDPGLRARTAGLGFPAAFAGFADRLTWSTPYAQLFDGDRPPFYRWFVGGRLNAAENCIDRHLAEHGDRPALHFVPENEREPDQVVTYRELSERVQTLAAYFRDGLGLRAGDRVTLHLPMTPELPISMLACARLGVVHSVVFAGFSAASTGQRIADSGSRILVTMDGYERNGRWIDHVAQAPAAASAARAAGQEVEAILAFARRPDRPRANPPVLPDGVVRLSDVLPGYEGRTVPPVPREAEDPLFLMYTSGTTGRPKGAQHGTGGYLAYAATTAQMILDVHPGDVYWCLADIGWITGHTYIVYGPLALGATTVLYEGAPAVPDAGRPWRIAERLGVREFYTSPTAIRFLRKLDPDAPRRSGHRFRVLGTVGEPIEPDAWRWYYEAVGHGEAAVVDTYWQTETGGILCSTLPGIDPMRPGSAGPPVPGIEIGILDERGAPLPDGTGRAGHLVVRTPWPGRMETIWKDDDRFVSTYFARFVRDRASRNWRDWPYDTGDAAVCSADGYVRILGRIDDVINVAGHRLGSKEIESACLTVHGVAEAAVVPVVDPVKGKRPEVFVTLDATAPSAEQVARQVEEAIVSAIGGIARPRAVRILPEMPKTRSGKILRRLLAALANGREVGDATTLSDPGVVETIRRALAAPEGPRDRGGTT